MESRILPDVPVTSIDDYVASGGGAGLEKARRIGSGAVIDEVARSGLGGRGGAGFAAGRKWAAVAANRSDLEPSTVVVNAAEGEPGSFKDRAIIRANSFAVAEGALIAAIAVGADQVIVATRASFTREADVLRSAFAAIRHAGWSDGVRTEVFEGPDEYLFGEETALLEVIDGRPPFPRLAPPYRRGVDEVVDSVSALDPVSGSAAHVELAGPGAETVAPPALASNVETYANAAMVLAHGAEWFRSVGTAGSPGTIVCTVSGSTRRAGVGEFAMGTPLAEVLETLGGGPRDGRTWTAAASGVSNALVPASFFSTPCSHEAMRAIGSGLGTGGFIVFDDADDLAGFAAGASRFLAVESCGQCARCKDDGLTIADALGRIARSGPHPDDLDTVRDRILTVADGSRCNLATQQQVVVGSVLDHFGPSLDAHVHGGAPGVEPMLVAALTEIAGGVATVDEHQGAKQPDWSYDPVGSDQWPADRFDARHEPPA